MVGSGYGNPKQLLGDESAAVNPPAQRRPLIDQRHGTMPGNADPRLNKNWLYEDAAKRWANKFKQYPPWSSIKSAEWPPNPDHTGKRIEFGPLLSKTSAKLAYLVWSLADNAVETAWRYRDEHDPSPQAEDPSPARNVSEHLMIFAVLPLDRKETESLLEEEELNDTWDTETIIESMKDEIIDQSSIRGIMRWSINAVKFELRARNLPRSGNLKELQDRLIEDEIHRYCGVMRQADLTHLEIFRPEKYILQPATNSQMTALDMYTFAIHLSPYNPIYWLSRAYCHYLHGHFDLALGDAYRAQILCNTIEQSKDRYAKDGLYTHIWHAVEEHVLVEPFDDDGYWSAVLTIMRGPQGIHPFISDIQKTLLNIICLSLAALNCWDDYDSYHRQLAARTSRIHIERYVADLRKLASRKAEKAYRKMRRRDDLFWYEKHQGAISAETPYPYEKDDIFRMNMPPKKTFLTKITEELFDHNLEEGLSANAPAGICEVQPSSLQEGLGVFAKVDIKEGQLIHFEEPTIRGHLPPRRMEKDTTSIPFVDDTRCENCKTSCDPNVRRPSIDDLRVEEDDDPEPFCGCPRHWTRRATDKRGTMFCPSNYRTETCVKIANDLYHYDGCGRNWRWLYDAMRPNLWNWSTIETISHSNEVHGTLLSLLLRSVAEVTIIRRNDYEDPSLSPHEIDELLILNGNNKSWRESWFPFTMAANIIVPFDILSFLGINIFSDLNFDTWTLQIALRKLLVSAVPWDKMRRGIHDAAVLDKDKEKQLENPSMQTIRRHHTGSFRDWDPSFQNLYMYPGFSMFNHTCWGAQNAEWAYDESMILNRVVVWASRDIKKGEEIRFRYQCNQFQNKYEAPRLLGAPCSCRNTAAHNHDADASDPESDVSSDNDSSGGGPNPSGSQAPRSAKHGQSGDNGPAGKRQRVDSGKGKGRAQDDGDVEMKDAPEMGDDDKGDVNEYARFEEGRGGVEIRRRVVPVEEDAEGEKRLQFQHQQLGSKDFIDLLGRKKNYSGLAYRNVQETTPNWLPRERQAMKDDREVTRKRIPGLEASSELTEVTQIARDPGVSIHTVEVPKVDFGLNVNHWRNFRTNKTTT